MRKFWYPAATVPDCNEVDHGNDDIDIQWWVNDENNDDIDIQWWVIDEDNDDIDDNDDWLYHHQGDVDHGDDNFGGYATIISDCLEWEW